MFWPQVVNPYITMLKFKVYFVACPVTVQTQYILFSPIVPAKRMNDTYNSPASNNRPLRPVLKLDQSEMQKIEKCIHVYMQFYTFICIQL